MKLSQVWITDREEWDKAGYVEFRPRPATVEDLLDVLVEEDILRIETSHPLQSVSANLAQMGEPRSRLVTNWLESE